MVEILSDLADLALLYHGLGEGEGFASQLPVLLADLPVEVVRVMEVFGEAAHVVVGYVLSVVLVCGQGQAHLSPASVLDLVLHVNHRLRGGLERGAGFGHVHRNLACLHVRVDTGRLHLDRLEERRLGLRNCETVLD